MSLLNLYSVSHLVIWFLAGRLSRMSWTVFVIISIGWEFLELLLPFEFAEEWTGNKLADIGVNIIGFYLGNRFRVRASNRAD
ncbi:MAG: hypothetical protein K9N29_10875 [Candidatus Marinimicrobia bacterium]|nr:hypothetical protein [Candidatus Neomarinimicrobiota bacterium]